MTSNSPGPTTMVSPEMMNLSAPEKVYESCSASCEWSGTTLPFLSRMWAAITFSPVMTWREIRSVTASSGRSSHRNSRTVVRSIEDSFRVEGDGMRDVPGYYAAHAGRAIRPGRPGD